ncbi:MAG: Rid family detoxifying hydrolase [Cyanobacteria bacterium REEB67]|nr:Rid family detoxifying hydrolase [Cyanobacteria bacterium REEB67]
MEKRAINPGDKSPLALGAYSHGLVVGSMLFVSGQGCRAPSTGEEVGLTFDGDGKIVSYDIEVQTRGVLENLGAVLTAAGLTFRDVVDVTVFLANMDDFEKYNRVYAQYFSFENAPTRTTVQVARLPGKNFIEIKAIAAFSGAKP